MIISEMYRFLGILSSLFMCVALGSNDVANAISPLIILMQNNGNPDWISFLIGSIGIAVGLLLLGRKVMDTVGNKIIVLDFQKDFSAQFSTACCVCLGSGLGLPISTTHCMVGSIFGMVFAEKTPIFNRFYWYPEGVEKPDLKKNIVISKILLAWLATVPVALGTTAGLCSALKNIK
jgi:inorganic phosphate transporter, PiT family